MATAPVLSVRGLYKSFGPVDVLRNLDMDFFGGEIHALLGQNGAGKSTLIKILSRTYTYDAGELQLDGEDFHSAAARETGTIAFVHQDLALSDTVTVAENVAFGAGFPIGSKGGFIAWRKVREQAARALAVLDVDIRPEASLADLSYADRALVAIARALAVPGAKVLILDEPTVGLVDREVRRLFKVLERVRRHGTAIIYVTHRLDEVFEIADRVSVLRDGRKVAVWSRDAFSPEELYVAITGKQPEVSERRQAPRTLDGVPALAFRDVTTPTVGPASLSVGRGEIAGICGLNGAGHSEIGRTVFGVEPVTGGELEVDGVPFVPSDASHAIDAGVGFISGKRLAEGLAPGMLVRENLFPSPKLTGPGSTRAGFLRPLLERRRAEQLCATYSIRPAPPSELLIDTLSGGNQQKVVLARWLNSPVRILIVEEPSAGVDVGARAEIYEVLRQFAAEGGSALIISSDPAEIVAVCTRTVVMHGGRVVADLRGDENTIERIGHVMAAGGELETERQQ